MWEENEKKMSVQVLVASGHDNFNVTCELFFYCVYQAYTFLLFIWQAEEE